MHLHILGICGTFMGGIAAIAKQMGFRVSGCDANVYPPMSTQLEQLGIELKQGYLIEHLADEPDLVIVGNAMARGNPMVEHVLDRKIAYTSGPQWLLENVLKDRWVLAVSGTHGKTTTSSMLTWILEYAGMEPGFLIGGVPQNFTCSARLGAAPFFVIEADEYDTAFFDKRSKFVHYRPNTLVINNMEFDHADIFNDISDIQRQFHHLIRMVPNNGLILSPKNEPAINETLAMGCWTPTEVSVDDDNKKFGWHAEKCIADGSEYIVSFQGDVQGTVKWNLIGDFNIEKNIKVVAHNIEFDNKFMNSEFQLRGLSAFEAYCSPVCTLNIFRTILPKEEVKKYKLDTIYEYTRNLPNTQVENIPRDVHGAYIDSLMLFQVTNEVLRTNFAKNSPNAIYDEEEYTFENNKEPRKITKTLPMFK